MTVGQRVGIGALLGAILTLALHPYARPLTLGPLVAPRPVPQDLRPFDPGNVPKEPKTLREAALWVHTAARKLETPSGLSRSELESLSRLTEAAARRDPENAFWLQSRAAFLLMQGNADVARQAWMRASRRAAWRDYQTNGFVEAQGHLSRDGHRGAWTAATLYYQRSDTMARLIERYARSNLARMSLNSREDLEFRLATLQNGALLRDGAQSLRVGARGASIVDLAGFPRNFVSSGSPKRMLIAQLDFSRALRDYGLAEGADRAFVAYRENDGWRWVSGVAEAENQADRRALQALGLAILLPGLLVGSFVGLVIWGIGVLGARRVTALSRPIAWVTGVFALAAGVLAWWGAGSQVLVGLVVAASVGFAGFSPNQARSHRDTNLGPLFAFVNGVLAITLLAGMVVLVGMVTAAGQSLAPVLLQVDPTADVIPDVVGVLGLVLSLVGVLATLWAYAQRVNTPLVLAHAIRRIGATMLVAGLVGFVAGGPLVLWLDQNQSRILEQLLTNEPVYYLLQ